MATWNQHASDVIRRVQLETGLHGDALRRELVKHYPFGERSHYPYKAWLKEVDAVCGISPRKRKKHPTTLFTEVAQ